MSHGLQLDLSHNYLWDFSRGDVSYSVFAWIEQTLWANTSPEQEQEQQQQLSNFKVRERETRGQKQRRTDECFVKRKQIWPEFLNASTATQDQ